jgi:hypothetical protein
MYTNIGHRLRALGRVKVADGLCPRGLMGWNLILVAALLYLCWYLLLGVLWVVYGIIYLCFVLPFRGLVRLFKRRKTQ